MEMIDVFVLAWNEERLIQQFIDWYSFATSITILDNYSTDNTVAIARDNNCNIIQYGSNQQDNKAMLEIKESCWKNSDADWVIVCDMDEFIYHPKLLKLLSQTSATVIKTIGYQMVSIENALAKNIKIGSREPGLDKSICFKPKDIQSMNWEYGCHNCKPIGNVRYLENSVKMLHYSMLGKEAFKLRWLQYRNRMSDWDKSMGTGLHYLWSNEIMDSEFNRYLSTSEKVW